MKAINFSDQKLILCIHINLSKSLMSDFQTIESGRSIHVQWHDFIVYVTRKLSIKWQTNIAHFDRKLFQYRSLTQAMKMHSNWRENLLFGDWVDLVNGDSCNLLSKLSFLKSFCQFLRQPRFGTSVYNFTASTFNGFIHIFSHHCPATPIVQMFHLVFHDGQSTELPQQS